MNPPRLTPGKPIADNIVFDDLWLLTYPLRGMLIARGLVWETVFTIGETEFCGTVIASDGQQAARIADSRGLGETLVGQFREALTASEDGD